MYLLEGIYYTIEDSTNKSLWVFEKESDANYYRNQLLIALELAETRFEQYFFKHHKDNEDGYNDYQTCEYISRISKVLLKKDIEHYFYLEAFLGLGYYDYLPTFNVKEIKFIKGIIND